MKMQPKFLLLLSFFTLGPLLLLFSGQSTQQTAAELFEKALYMEEAQGDLRKAIETYEKLLAQYPKDRETAARAQLHIGICYEKLGVNEAFKAYQKVVEGYPEQTAAVAMAREKLDKMMQSRSPSTKGDWEVAIRRIQIPPGFEGSGVVSPDGKYLADIDANTGDICISEIITGKQRRLTNEGKNYSQYAYALQWSQDSNRIVFKWFNADSTEDLRVVAIDGSAPVVLVDASKGKSLIPRDWSSDGRYILAANSPRQKNVELNLVSVADRSIRPLRAFQDPDLAPNHCRFSPDGLFVAYSRRSRKDSRERDIFLLAAEGSREIPLVQHPVDDNFLEWLPDGRGVLFASDRAGSMDLWIVRIERGQPQGAPVLIRRSIGPVTTMRLTKSGAFYYRTPGSIAEVYTARLDPKTGDVTGSPSKESLPFEGRNRMPAWSPDGKLLAYGSQRPDEGVFCIYSADTGKVREYRFDKPLGFPHWAPDGRHLYLQSTGGQGIYRLDVESGEVAPFLAAGDGEYPRCLQVSADGKWIVYDRVSKQVSRILCRDARSGQEQEIARTSFGIGNSTLSLSPDGDRLAMILRTDQNTRVLKVLKLPDGTPVEIRRLTELGWPCEVAWSADGRFIYYNDRLPSGGSSWRLWRIAAEGGNAQDLGLMGYLETLSVHPDGSRITFSVYSGTADRGQYWVMENFLSK